MSGLILKLAPNERVLINGAVIENGDKRSRISVKTPNANILRLRDAIHPDDAKTPVSRTCYLCQLLLVGEADENSARRDILIGIEQLSRALIDRDSMATLDAATASTLDGNYYQTLKQLRTLLPREARLLAAARS
ncbi:flagellar biosynthesis repressor FlbT [Paracoccus shanxieyensis]|uniref:Flagellar biosynthesis repressor FlbT n=1 Tax=Paracoccus shanxieyensis TaxID=2675752 RepID=A0A6L6J1H3_9RHOB|nr:flagellar biosynthesis repressor FlbT [Paracoccus shanxieyensis]MTH64634.1 flagellar biosynthesis repressor FlbT [Paracoccus shanxieyensis]MTH87778.1 flagellar biosynthesis repressor FlbT [Paracoccus shanxieyensis]